MAPDPTIKVPLFSTHVVDQSPPLVITPLPWLIQTLSALPAPLISAPLLTWVLLA